MDPGIDHLTACELFDNVKASNGRIKSFVSWCGGLPAPEASNNPLGYKFSWSPKGVLLAGLNSATFKRDGKIQTILGHELLANAIEVPIFKGFAFEGLANRDSLQYVDQYQLGKLDDIYTMFRGTLRYKGYSELMSSFVKLGYFNSETQHFTAGMSWAELSRKLGNMEQKNMASKLKNNAVLPRLVDAIKWLGLNDPKLGVDAKATSTLDAFCSLLQDKLVYEPHERDMVAMHHEFGIECADGTAERVSSTMIAYGEPGSYSAMAKTVGLPAAIATKLILDGIIKETGVVAPMSKAVRLF